MEEKKSGWPFFLCMGAALVGSYLALKPDVTVQQKAIALLQSQGYSQVEYESFSWTGCPKATKIRANLQATYEGERVKVLVCAEHILKKDEITVLKSKP